MKHTAAVWYINDTLQATTLVIMLVNMFHFYPCSVCRELSLCMTAWGEQTNMKRLQQNLVLFA